MDDPRPDTPRSPTPPERSSTDPPAHPIDPTQKRGVDPLDSPTLTAGTAPAAGGMQRSGPDQSGASPLAGETLRIGPYRLLGKLGAGGMGEVYHAEQEKPLRRSVALKLIKSGLDTKQVIARFDSERQALALLSHPNIAQVFDAGSTPEGRPYFVMEFVEGVSITTYCREQRLSIPERLRLFCEICDGVQHAHQKGIIHRDLKPSNILITTKDGKSVPKIIDFGVAKATAHHSADHTLVTTTGYAVGTPGYMSPEQAGMADLDIDTRSDVYALGLILHELLVGELPFGPERIRSEGLEAYLHSLRVEDAVRPSTRFDVRSERTAHIAKERRTDAFALRRQLRGDLDWIVLKALEKDRTRRYDSASEMAADVLRHLGHEPVLAGPPSTLYRVLKFVRRHRVGVSASAVVVLALIAGILGTTMGLFRAIRAEREARQEAETARRVTDFLVGLFRVSAPDSARGNQITAREVLDQGYGRIQRELADQPRIRARLMGTMGEVYYGLGLGRQAGTLFEEALSVQRAVLPEDSPDLIRSLLNLADLQKGTEGRRMAERALEISRSTYGEQHDVTASCMYYLGLIITLEGDFEDGKRLLEGALARFRKSTTPDHRMISWCLNDLALGYGKKNDWAQALPLLEEAARLKAMTLGPNHWDSAMALNNVGYAHLQLGHHAEAESLIHRALAITKTILGENHPRIAVILQSLGEAYIRRGDDSSAGVVLERSLAIIEKTLPDGPSLVLGETLRSLADIDSRGGLLELAEDKYRRAIAGYEELGGPMMPDIAPCLDEYAAHLDRAGKHPEADRARKRARMIRDRGPSGEGMPDNAGVEGLED